MGVESIIICKHGNLGFSASLRFKDKTFDCELAHTDKKKLYSMINYAVRKRGLGYSEYGITTKPVLPKDGTPIEIII